MPDVENAARVIGALRDDGAAAWRADWPYVENFFAFRRSLYLGGSHARRVDIGTGRLLVEREFDAEVNILPPITTGPVYSDPGRIMGLDPEDLSIAWEVPRWRTLISH